MVRNGREKEGESLLTQRRRRRIPSTRLIHSRLQRFHILGIKLEIEDLGILLDPRMRDAFGQNHKYLLQTPAQQDLGGSLLVLFR